jgi:uncharacterized membrane protein YeiB
MAGWQEHRVLGVDAARGVALLGMMSVHIIAPVRPDGSVAPAFLLAAGRSAALFAVLAGVGLALLAGGSRPRRGRDLLRTMVSVLVRAGLLVLIGLLLGHPDSGVAVILVYYGAFFALAAPFLGLGARTLALLAAATAVVVPALSHAVRDVLPPATYQVPRLGFFTDQPLTVSLSELLLTGYYPALPWMTYLFAGMAVGKLSLRSRRVGLGLLGGGAALAVGARLLSGWLLGPAGGLEVLRAEQTELFGRPLEEALSVGLYGTTPSGSWWWLAVTAPHSASPLDLATTTGSALAVLGLFLLVLPGSRAGWATPLVAIGGMPLTLYSLHVVMLAGPLSRDLPQAYVWHVLLAVAVAVPWRLLVGPGPLEYLTQRAARTISTTIVPVRQRPTMRS